MIPTILDPSRGDSPRERCASRGREVWLALRVVMASAAECPNCCRRGIPQDRGTAILFRCPSGHKWFRFIEPADG